jgi:hypothetical protein
MIFSQSCEADGALFSFLDLTMMIKFNAMDVDTLIGLSTLDGNCSIGMD